MTRTQRRAHALAWIVIPLVMAAVTWAGIQARLRLANSSAEASQATDVRPASPDKEAP